MKRLFSIIIASICLLSVQAQDLNLKDITAGKYYSKGVQAVTSSADGESYFQANESRTQIIRYSYKTGKEVEVVYDASKARGTKLSSFQGFIVSPTEHSILLFNEYEPVYRHSFKANYYYFDVRHNSVRPLTENKGKQSIPTYSHDGRMAAFVIENNIWLAKFDYETESQITKDGEFNKIINGATDWVYEEEFGTTSIMDFSADNTLLAFAKFDESHVKEFSFQTYNNELYPGAYSFKYPKTGEDNSKVSINVFDISAKTIREIKLPENTEYIPRIEFLPSGDDLAIMTLNREQNEFNMYFANARSTMSKQILRENNKRYLDSDLMHKIYFLEKDFVYVSEKDGYTHIYLYDNTGLEKMQLTKGNYDVTDLLAVDPIAGLVFYQSAEEGTMYRTINSVDMKKGKVSKLSSDKGYNSATFSTNGKYFVNRFSTSSTPTVITLNDAKGKELRTLEDNKALKEKLAKLNLPTKEFTTVKGADGTDLQAYIMKPANFDASRKYPLLMVQYSGPNSQQVLDNYFVDWTDFLTTQGYVVACVDGHGTGARGEEFRKCTYMNLGIKEADDQIAAAKNLGALPYIDSKNIAIWGWSYGGYNTLMSMSKSKDVFKAGVAIAPVTDWKFYDTVYGERFMRTPQQNMSGYKAGSPIELASQLNGKLLLIHGSADDNVHFQNSVAYIDALIKADKQFEMFMFPDKNHSILGASTRNYLYSKIINFLNTNLK